MKKLVAVLLMNCLCAWPQADANKAQIAGAVHDPNKAVVPNATVKLRNAATGFQREVKTNELGQYRVLLLDPGRYELSVESAGFATSRFEGVVLNVGASVVIDVALQLQSTTTTVEVGETLLNTVLPAQATVIDTTAITNLPINGRRFQDFAVFAPTVQVDPQRQQLSFAGQRGINANVMLDGADYNQPFFGGIRGGERSNFVFTVPQSAIQEFQVVATGYSAEYGRSTGGILNTITKSGANDVHGDAFYQIRHKEMGARNPVLKVQPTETLQQFGGSTGGPIRRDRLFFFAAVEQQYSKTPRRVFFSQLLNRTPDANTAEAFNFLKGEEKPFRQTNDATALSARTDYQFSGGHRLTLRYVFSNASGENAVSVGGALNPLTNQALTNEGIEKDRTHTGTAQYTHLLSPTLINDLRFTGSYEIRPRLANSAIPQVSNLIGTFGARSFLPTTQDDLRFQITDGLSLNRGGHTLKIGIDYSRITTGQVFGFNQFGSFNISGSDVARLLDILSTGGSVANRFDTRDVTYSRQIGDLLAQYGVHQFAAYAQDSWRVTPKLTLDLGLRWEGQWNPTPETNNTAVVDRVRSARFPIGSTLDPTQIPDSPAQVMPRFGFAWTPTSGARRTVVRGHTGLFYAATPMLLFAGATNNFRVPPGDLSIAINPTATQTVYQQFLAAGVDLNRTPLGQLPVVPIETVQRTAALAAGGVARDPYLGINVLAMAPDFRNPRSFQAGLGVDSELARNFLAGVQLHYVNTVHLQRNRNYNLPGPVIRPTDRAQRPFFGLRSGTPRPVTTLSDVTSRESSARSLYRAMTFSTQYKTRRFQFGVFYTLARTYSDDDNERDAGGFGYENSFNLRPDYNYSRMDVRHQFASYAVATLPWGFETSGLFRTRSGLPMNATTGADTNEDLASNDRPYSAPGVPFLRNSFRNRKSLNADLRVLRNFRLGSDRIRLQFSTEFFNLFDVDNVVFAGANASVYGLGIDAAGNAVAIDPRFQRLRLTGGAYDPTNQQTGSPLQVQFGLRLFF